MTKFRVRVPNRLLMNFRQRGNGDAGCCLGSLAHARSTEHLPGETLLTPLFSLSPWRALFHAGLQP